MKFVSPALVLCACLIVSCAHGPGPASAPVLPGESALTATVAVASYALGQHPASLQLAKKAASP